MKLRRTKKNCAIFWATLFAMSKCSHLVTTIYTVPDVTKCRLLAWL